MSKETEMQRSSNFVMSNRKAKGGKAYLIDVLIIIVMGTLLFMGSFVQMFKEHSDGARYQCYALAFLHNIQFAKAFLPSQCGYILNFDVQTSTNTQIAATLHTYGAPEFLSDFVAKQDVSLPLHSLPHEYPLLTLIPFLLVIAAPHHWYQVAFAILMILLAGVMYSLLVRLRSRRVAIVGAALLVIGCWGTAAQRFDLIPSLLTLLAVFLGERKRWTGAFVLLALAFLLKFYPVVLLLPFVLAQQMQEERGWASWKRWQPLATFCGVCIVVMGTSLLLSVEGTLGPLSYFQTRPIQAESFGSSIIWLTTFLQYHPLTFEFTYGSLNVIHIYSSLVATLESIVEVVGLAYIAWLQWRRKMDLARATLFTLLVVIVMGKVFSPQYLIWVVPLLAYVGGASLSWILAWGAIGALTTFVYPYVYDMAPIVRVPLVPWFYPLVTLRNFILFGFVLTSLILYACRKDPEVSYHPAVHHEEQA